MSITYEKIRDLLASGLQEEMEKALGLLEVESQASAWLKDLAAVGDIQRNLLQLHSALETEHAEFYQKVEMFELTVAALDINALNRDTVISIRKELNRLHHQLQRFRILSAPAVRLAWNTGRQELIDKWSRLRESVERDELSIFGEEDPASQKETVKSKIQNKLYSTFGATQDDLQPILDALTAFSIWSIIEYWQLGLLPQITDKADLETGVTSRLFEIAKKNLEKIGLKTLKDLKDQSIFSRKCLQEYIASKRSLL